MRIVVISTMHPFGMLACDMRSLRSFALLTALMLGIFLRISHPALAMRLTPVSEGKTNGNLARTWQDLPRLEWTAAGRSCVSWFSESRQDPDLENTIYFCQSDNGWIFAALNVDQCLKNALSALKYAQDNFEVLGHYNVPPKLNLTEAAVNLSPDKAWMAIGRQKRGATLNPTGRITFGSLK